MCEPTSLPCTNKQAATCELQVARDHLSTIIIIPIFSCSMLARFAWCGSRGYVGHQRLGTWITIGDTLPRLATTYGLPTARARGNPSEVRPLHTSLLSPSTLRSATSDGLRGHGHDVTANEVLLRRRHDTVSIADALQYYCYRWCSRRLTAQTAGVDNLKNPTRSSRHAIIGLASIDTVLLKINRTVVIVSIVFTATATATALQHAVSSWMAVSRQEHQHLCLALVTSSSGVVDKNLTCCPSGACCSVGVVDSCRVCATARASGLTSAGAVALVLTSRLTPHTRAESRARLMRAVCVAVTGCDASCAWTCN